MAEASEFGTIRDGKVYRNAFLDFPEREIGELRGSEEETYQYFNERFALVEKEVAEVEEKINNTTNKGSYLMKILHLKETMAEKDALGDFAPLYQKVCEHEAALGEQIAQNRQKNLEIKTALLTDLTEATKSSEWKSASEEVKVLQGKWLKTGSVGEDKKEEIEGQYKAITQAFYDRRAAFYADLEKMMEEKEVHYTDFLKKAEQTLNGVAVADMKSATATLIEEWKGLGRIKREKQNEYWAQFQALMKKAWNEAKKAGKGGQKVDYQANKSKKEEFIEKLRVLNEALEPNVELNAVKLEWKQLGPVNKKEVKALQAEYLLQYDLLSEKLFLKGMLAKRLSGRDKGGDPKKLRQRILRDLLDRDIRELNAFKENLEKFSTRGNFEEMLGNKLEHQERKVQVKKMILSQLRTAE